MPKKPEKRAVETSPTEINPVAKLLEKMKEAEHLASANIDDYPLNIRAGMLIQIGAARAQLEPLRKEIRQATVPSRLVGIFAEGDAVAAAATARFLVDTGGVVVDAGDLYQFLADRVEASFSARRVFGVTQYSLMLQALKEVLERVGLTGVELPSYREWDCATPADTVAYVRTAVLSSCPAVASLYVQEEILGAVVREELAGTKIPVLVTGTGEEDRPALQGLFSRAVTHVFEPDFVPTQEAIVKILKP